MQFGGSLVGGRRFFMYLQYCTTTVLQYVQKLFENSFRRFRSRSLQRLRESNAESARSRRLDDIHNRINQGPGASLLLFSVKKLLLMRHKYEARLFKDKRTATGTNFHSVAIKIRFRPAFRCTPRMLLPPPPLDGLLTDSTNYGCK